ncbi:MAG: transcriptional regulator [Hyphomicrobiales bacterium]|nr:MAG: transcriptional regulator [Hyphomicrobiales bacterium]
MRALDIDQLASFVAIADAGSFTQAADRVNRTQSAVSLQMKKLEENVGKPLFAREGRQSRLTDNGQRLLNYARRMLALNAETLTAFSDETERTFVRIGIPDDYAPRLLPRIFAGFARTHPNLEISMTCQSSNEVNRRVKAGDLDLGIVTHGDVVRDFGDRAQIIRSEPLFFLGSDTHMTHLLDPLPLAVGPTTCCWRRAAIQALEDHGRAYRIAFVSGSATAMIGAITAGLAVGVLPESALNGDLRVLGPAEGVPRLAHTNIALIKGHTATHPVHIKLAEHIAMSLDNLSTARAA